MIRSTQYKSIIFYHNEEQRELAEASKKAMEEELGKEIYTEIRPYKEFYIAEDYHQKYYLRSNKRLLAEFNRYYSSETDFVESTLASRLNGYSSGRGSVKDLKKEIDSYGLTETGEEHLLGFVSN
jgi:peptide-methionine (S)-S-oxide reductase